MVTPQHIDKLWYFLSAYSQHDQMAMFFRNGVDQDSQNLKLVLFTQGYDFVKSVYLSLKTTDIVSGGAWGRRPHTLSEPTLLVNNILK